VLATVVFVDIVRSSELAAELGDARWRVLLERYHRLVRREVKAWRGRVVDSAGDGFFLRFSSQEYAVRAACAMVSPDAGRAVLDAPCGHGRLAMVDRHHCDPVANRIHADGTFVVGASRETTGFSVRLFTVSELRDWPLDAGFATVDAVGPDGAPFELESARMVMRAVRAA
jgi:hypothetical protein